MNLHELMVQPLTGLLLTLLLYVFGLAIYRRSGGNPLANPVIVAMVVLVPLLIVTGTPYAEYFRGAQFIHFLLGPATVALAIPLHAQIRRLRTMFTPLVTALLAGSATAVVSAVLIGRALGASRETLLSLAPKSVTTPIAMGIAERLGGLPPLAAVLVILTGTLGIVVAQPIYRLLRIHDPATRGFALGLAAHGIGTARAFQMNEISGAFAGLAMGLNGLLTAVMLPLLLPLLG
ncbi:MAG: LrgB family protein [Proteobacteria bacterium]|nr:LrgB family protein [Pseudomonadota bacterium]HQR03950.1 LrgB family protein [Rhodocyclaceae bacterium]